MDDLYNRKIDYLRISVTDRCNLRCFYCMPECGIEKSRHSDIASFEELYEMAQACTALGVHKIRVTGGEPLVRLGVLDFLKKLGGLPGVDTLCITTNGSLLAGCANELKEAGVNRLNISLDTLNPEKYRRISRVGTLSAALDGFHAALSAGFENIKVNAVLIGGVNDDEIEDLVNFAGKYGITLRFIELMPIGECAGWDKSHFISGETVLKRVPGLVPIGSDGVARLYGIPGTSGRVGLISPVSHRFCSDCNRIRITSDGKLKPCLHSGEEINLRGLHGEELLSAIKSGILKKPLRHRLSEGEISGSARNMNAIGG